MQKKQLSEGDVVVGGGATGVSSVPGPVTTGDTSRKQDKKNGQSMETLNDPNAAVNATDIADAGKNAASIAAKPSAAKMEDVEASFNADELFEAFGSKDLTEEFKEKVSTIFSAAVHSRLTEEVSKLEEAYAKALDEQVEEITSVMYENVDKYLSYAIEQWIEENQVAIETSLRADIAESFMAGLKDLFVEHHVSVPDEGLDVMAEMVEEIEKLEAAVNEKIEENIQLQAIVNEAAKHEILSSVAEGLALTQQEKLKTLAESVAFEDVDSYKHKLQTLKESFIQQTGKPVAKMLSEASEQELDEQTEVTGPMAHYIKAIKRTSRI